MIYVYQLTCGTYREYSTQSLSASIYEYARVHLLMFLRPATEILLDIALRMDVGTTRIRMGAYSKLTPIPPFFFGLRWLTEIFQEIPIP